MDNGTVGPAAVYSWTLTGTYTLTVTATGVCGDSVTAARSVRVLERWPFAAYLPLVWR